MSRSTRRLRQAAVLNALVFPLLYCSAAWGNQESPIANNPVAIDGQEIVVADAAPSEASPITSTSAPGSSLEDKTASNESLGLGAPNSLLSSRPVSTEDEESGGLLSMVDPRKNEIVRLFGAMGLIIGLILALKWILQRSSSKFDGADRPSGVLEVLARYPFGKGQQLVLLKLGRRIILTHQTAEGLATVSEITEENEVASLLARVEAGTRKKGEKKFQAFLNNYQAHHTTQSSASSPGRIATSSSDGEIIDLTRSRRSGFASWFAPRPRRSVM